MTERGEHTPGIVERLRAKARGERNSIGDYWGDWICDEAADLISELVGALERAAGVLETLAENEPDCLGWHPPFPSTTSGISVEAKAARAIVTKARGGAE